MKSSGQSLAIGLAGIVWLTHLNLAWAANWPHWRGPELNGSTAETNLPTRWSQTEGVAWVAPMPGPGAATPIIWNDVVLISSTDLSNRCLVAMGLDRKTGQVLWRHQTGEVIQRDDRSNFASSSPITDGQRAFFFYSSGELRAFDLAGQPLWRRNIQADEGDFAFLWTFSSTPLLFEGKLYLQVLQRNVPVNGRGRRDGPIDSYLLAMNPETGKTLWKQARPSDAVAESREAYSSPIPFRHAGRTELLIAGGDLISGHDPETGREFWRWGTWNPSRIGHWRLVPSPVAGTNVVLACGPKGSPIFAVKAGQSGVLTDAGLAWNSGSQRMVSADVPTPLYYQGDFFVLNDLRRALSRVEAATGHVKWSVELPGRSKYEASPTGADGRLFCINFRGEVTVLSAADGQVLTTVPMAEEGEDRIRSTVAAAHGQLFIRTNKKLFCVGGR